MYDCELVLAWTFNVVVLKFNYIKTHVELKVVKRKNDWMGKYASFAMKRGVLIGEFLKEWLDG